MKNDKNEQEKYYTVEQVARILQVHWQTILSYIKAGELGAFKLGRGYRISEQDLKDFVANKRVGKK